MCFVFGGSLGSVHVFEAGCTKHVSRCSIHRTTAGTALHPVAARSAAPKAFGKAWRWRRALEFSFEDVVTYSAREGKRLAVFFGFLWGRESGSRVLLVGRVVGG